MTHEPMLRVPGRPAGRFDAAIVGGGLMGAMVAFDLARAGMRIVLLERKPGVCMEASCMNTDALMLQLIRAAFIPHALRTIELWRSAPRWLGADMGYVRNGDLAVAFDDDEAQKPEGWIDDRRAAGAPVKIASRERARALEPALTDRIRLASYCGLDGFADAKLTGAGFRQGLARVGVDVRAPVTVRGIEREKGGFAVVHEEGAVRARRVVLAGGVWLGEMSGWLGLPLPVECRVNQVSVTERMPPILTRSVCAATGRLSLKQSPAGTFLVGGGWQGIGSPADGGYEIVPDHLVANLRMACFTVPAMRGARLLRTWLGLEAKVPDYLPVAGALPGVDDVWVVGAAHGGYTVGLSIARSLADTVLERESECQIRSTRAPIARPSPSFRFEMTNSLSKSGWVYWRRVKISSTPKRSLNATCCSARSARWIQDERHGSRAFGTARARVRIEPRTGVRLRGVTRARRHDGGDVRPQHAGARDGGAPGRSAGAGTRERRGCGRDHRRRPRRAARRLPRAGHPRLQREGSGRRRLPRLGPRHLDRGARRRHARPDRAHPRDRRRHARAGSGASSTSRQQR